MQNQIKIKTGKNEKDIMFDWDNQIIRLIKSNNGIENLIKIVDLFEGYPDFFIKNFLKKYID